MKNDYNIILSSIKQVIKKKIYYTTIILTLPLLVFITSCGGLPEAKVTASVISGQAPLSVTFTNKSVNADQFQWDFGDGTAITTTDVHESVSHKYTRAGTNMMTLTVFKKDKTEQINTATINIVIEPGLLASVKVIPGTLEMQVNESQQLSAEAYDAYGNLIEDVHLIWEADEEAGRISENGLFTAGTKAGVFEKALKVTASSNNQILEATAPVIVNHGFLDQVKVEPSTAILSVGDVQQFTALAMDAYGNPIQEAQIVWEIGSQVGSITSEGLFTAGKHADEGIRITALLDNKAAENTVSVVLKLGQLDHLKLTPQSVNLYFGQNQQFTVQAFDINGIPIPDVALAWEVIEGPGTINSNGVFTSGMGLNVSESTIYVTVTSNEIYLSATSKVLISKWAAMDLIYIGMNTKSPYIFNDSRIRRAVYLSFDRNEITTWINGVQTKESKKVTSIVSLSDSNPNINRDQDIETAKELLAESGYPNGFKIKLYVKNDLENVAGKVKSYLASVGIDTQIIVITDDNSLMSLSSAEPYLFLTGIDSKSPDTGDLLGRLFLTTSLDNFSGYSNATFDQLYNSNKFSEAESEVFKNNSIPIIPLYWSPEI